MRGKEKHLKKKEIKKRSDLIATESKLKRKKERKDNQCVKVTHNPMKRFPKCSNLNDLSN